MVRCYSSLSVIYGHESGLIWQEISCASYQPSVYSFDNNKIDFWIILQGGQDHFLPKEMLISTSILKLHKNP